VKKKTILTSIKKI